MDWILWVLGILAVIWVIGSASQAGKGTDRKAKPRKPKAKLAEQEEHSKPTPEHRVGYKVDQNINAANMTTIWAGDCPHIEFTSNGNRFSAMPDYLKGKTPNRCCYILPKGLYSLIAIRR